MSMNKPLDTYKHVYRAAKQYRNGEGDRVDYFAARECFNGMEHDAPVQVGAYAYFVDSSAWDDGSNRRYRVCRIGQDGRVERYPFDHPGQVLDHTTLDDALMSRDGYVRKLRIEFANDLMDAL